MGREHFAVGIHKPRPSLTCPLYRRKIRVNAWPNHLALPDGRVAIENSKHQGDFNSLTIPEGGGPLSYSILCGLTMFAGILIARKQRCTVLSAHSS